MAINVLYVIHYPFFGGPQNQALRTAKPLPARGVNTIVVLPDEPGNAAERLRSEGIEVLTLPLHRLRAVRDPTIQARFLGGLPREVIAIRRLIRDRSRSMSSKSVDSSILTLRSRRASRGQASCGRCSTLEHLWRCDAFSCRGC